MTTIPTLDDIFIPLKDLKKLEPSYFTPAVYEKVEAEDGIEPINVILMPISFVKSLFRKRRLLFLRKVLVKCTSVSPNTPQQKNMAKRMLVFVVNSIYLIVILRKHLLGLSSSYFCLDDHFHDNVGTGGNDIERIRKNQKSCQARGVPRNP